MSASAREQDQRPPRLRALEETRSGETQLAIYGFDALAAGAAAHWPQALALADHPAHGGQRLSFFELDQAIGACLARLRDFDFAPGERALLLCAPGVQAVVALGALVAAGLTPVAAPPHLAADALTEAAIAAQAALILAPTRFSGLDLEERLLAAAARAPSVRLIGALTPELFDGAEDFSPQALALGLVARAPCAYALNENAQIGAYADGGLHFMPQGRLFVRALEFARLTRGDGAAPVLSLVSCGGFAGLVAGPLAALIAGAPLHLLAPFEAARFLATLDALGPARLVAPGALMPFLARAGLATSGALSSLTLLLRAGEPLPEGILKAACPIVALVVDGDDLTIAPLNRRAGAPKR
jgi:acyl-CoA synthetase (AMP-forming)/AMP-acid ligase II